MKNEATYLPLRAFERIPQEFYKNAKQIDLSGMGEPLLHPDWDDIFDLVNRLSPAQISFNSSFTLCNEERLQKIVEFGTSPAISIDAATKKTFEEIRYRSRYDHVFGSVFRMMEIAREVNNPKFYPRVQWTLYKRNLDELAQFVDIAADAGLPEIRVQPLAAHRPEMQEWCCDPRDPEVQQSLARALEAANTRKVALFFHEHLICSDELQNLMKTNHSLHSGSHELTTYHHRPDSKGCSFPWTQMNIDSEGYVVACCFSDYRLGNILNQDIWEIWNNFHFAHLRREVNSPELCKYCVDSPSGGICCPRIQYINNAVLTSDKLNS
jgi:radical SAM protein with 4Fe4S-binding SPASM domain